MAGGIGSGKSVISRILRQKGYQVYDCDTRARYLMENSQIIKSRIRDEISADVTDGSLPPDRRRLAEIVFHDKKMLKCLNAIVHGVVRDDVRRTVESMLEKILFVEAAVMAQSGLADICDEIWIVEAPVQQRIERVMVRDSINRDAVDARIKSQEEEAELLSSYGAKLKVVRNDSIHSLLLQLDELLKRA
ncbi:MAG: dephospho-CoA kinase [Muribaculaceae bacterium]|nr:dephospho-CoA kinase [Muribaculaceae bacterium]